MVNQRRCFPGRFCGLFIKFHCVPVQSCDMQLRDIIYSANRARPAGSIDYTISVKKDG